MDVFVNELFNYIEVLKSLLSLTIQSHTVFVLFTSNRGKIQHNMFNSENLAFIIPRVVLLCFIFSLLLFLSYPLSLSSLYFPFYL